MKKSLLLMTTVAALTATQGVPAMAAAIRQTVFVEFDPGAPGLPETDADFISGDVPEDIDQEILAQISGRGGFGALTAAAGRFGEIGLSGTGGPVGTYRAFATISNSDIVNLGSRPAQATTRFIIDGGELALYAPQGSFINFRLLLNATTTDLTTGNSVSRDVFEASTRIEMSGDFTNPLFGITGDDISATATAQEGNGGRIDIAPSLQTVDLGVIAPNERLALFYSASFTMEVTGPLEFATFAFSDPLTVGLDDDRGLDGGGNWAEISLTPVSAVPLPAAAPLLAAGLAALGLAARRGR